LRSAAGDLNYEWKMAKATATTLAQAQHLGNQWIQNMALESFLVHARNVRDFFATAGSNDDVLAADFLSVPPTVRMPFLRSAAIRRRLNRRIAHLSFSRSRLKREWNVRRLLNEIDSAMSTFVDRLRKASPKLASIVDAA
jgi:hypothetical protein